MGEVAGGEHWRPELMFLQCLGGRWNIPVGRGHYLCGFFGRMAVAQPSFKIDIHKAS